MNGFYVKFDQKAVKQNVALMCSHLLITHHLYQFIISTPHKFYAKIKRFSYCYCFSDRQTHIHTQTDYVRSFTL